MRQRGVKLIQVAVGWVAVRSGTGVGRGKWRKKGKKLKRARKVQQQIIPRKYGEINLNKNVIYKVFSFIFFSSFFYYFVFGSGWAPLFHPYAFSPFTLFYCQLVKEQLCGFIIIVMIFTATGWRRQRISRCAGERVSKKSESQFSR